MARCCWLPWFLPLLIFLAFSPCDGSSGADPTAGFTAVDLTEDVFKLHKPHDLPPEQCYEFLGGVRRMWVLCTDHPFSHGSTTKPRSEILLNKTYTSGVWQFEGYGYMPSGTTGVPIMQVFGASGRNTTLMLHVYGGRLMHYHDEARVVDDGDIYDRWSRVAVVVEGEERLTVAGHGGYKFGVYTQTDPSHYMESRWRDIKVYTKIVD